MPSAVAIKALNAKGYRFREVLIDRNVATRPLCSPALQQGEVAWPVHVRDRSCM